MNKERHCLYNSQGLLSNRIYFVTDKARFWCYKAEKLGQAVVRIDYMRTVSPNRKEELSAGYTQKHVNLDNYSVVRLKSTLNNMELTGL